jgi:hypothetical protein
MKRHRQRFVFSIRGSTIGPLIRAPLLKVVEDRINGRKPGEQGPNINRFGRFKPPTIRTIIDMKNFTP